MKVLCLLGVACAAASRASVYAGQKVVSCVFSNAANMNASVFQQMDHELDVWDISSNTIDIRVRSQKELRQVYEAFGRDSCVVAMDDLEARVEAHLAENELARKTGTWHESYHTYAEIIDWYNALARNSPIVSITSGGRSIEGREQPIVTINGLGSPANKNKLMIQCQIHAREWISSATCMYFVDYIVSNYGSNPTVTNILDRVTLVMFPFVNPDGYSFTWTDQRLWRKNRRINTGQRCDGVDLNRNYNDQWGGAGSSPDPCSETYRGTAAASEVEVRNSVAAFRANAPVVGFIDVHSYGQLILRPLSWSVADARDEVRMRTVGDRMRDLIRGVSGSSYTSAKWFSGLYVSTGVASDWVYQNDATSTNRGFRSAGYCLELRPTTANPGFTLPPSQIIPTGNEVIPAILHWMDNLAPGIPA